MSKTGDNYNRHPLAPSSFESAQEPHFS